ncbi:MAG: hypothetical protein JRI25_02025 [Deltaproteobacteria bacterium]|nr:hypothetical protein [Deltaproteobacteria bacterium]MBW2253359.1 hypothetical protein [Deltaproteobacteria bacterium]
MLRPDDRGQLGEPGEGVRHGGSPGWRLIGLTEGVLETVFGDAAPFATSPVPGGAGEVAPLRVVQCPGSEGRSRTVRAQLPLFEVPRARAA